MIFFPGSGFESLHSPLVCSLVNHRICTELNFDLHASSITPRAALDCVLFTRTSKISVNSYIADKWRSRFIPCARQILSELTDIKLSSEEITFYMCTDKT